MREALLALEDGRVFRGRAVGAAGERHGEVVFNTAMAGYQEVLTDPSYCGQIVVMTCPEIGNYGINPGDAESDRPHVEGFVMRSWSAVPSSWRAEEGLGDFLARHGIPGIAEVDTRALTRHLRATGSLRGVLSSVDDDVAALVRKAQAAPGLGEQDLVERVSCREAYRWQDPRPPAWRTRLGIDPALAPRSCVAIDYGVKRQSLRLLVEHGFEVTVVPARTTARQVLDLRPDAVFLSNGPGDPATLTDAVRAVRGLIGEVPVLGICLGHQLAGLALGGRTSKLRFGHHGVNHPVRDERTGRIAVTSQNHGYTVEPASLPAAVERTHVSLNDGTCEGFALPEAHLIAVQFHPESAPGPHDSHDVFREFRALVDRPRVGTGRTLEAGS